MMVQMKEIRQLYVVPCTYGDVMYCVDIDQNTVSNLQWHNHVCINHRSFFFFFFLQELIELPHLQNVMTWGNV